MPMKFQVNVNTLLDRVYHCKIANAEQKKKEIEQQTIAAAQCRVIGHPGKCFETTVLSQSECDHCLVTQHLLFKAPYKSLWTHRDLENV